MGSREVLRLPQLRIGIFWDWFTDAAPCVVDACRHAVTSLQTEMGCQVRHLMQCFPAPEPVAGACTADADWRAGALRMCCFDPTLHAVQASKDTPTS